MKTLAKSLVLSVFATAVLTAASPALANMPILSASYQGSNYLQVTVNSANPNSQIDLYFMPQGSSAWQSTTNIGRTDYAGYFTQSVSLGQNINQLYVIVGGQQSSTISVNSGGCTYNCGSPYGLSLSQNSLSLSAGQNSSITIYNNSGAYSGSYYIASNSNSGVASAYISGNSLNINALTSGSTSIQVCANSSSGNCASVYVTVSGSSVGGLTITPSSLSLTAGQSATANVSIGSYIYTGGYYISSNSNSNVASASLSGSSLTVYALTAGSSSIQVCSNNYSGSCATLYVTVTGSVLGANTNLWFSPGNPNLYVGQSLAVSINSSAYTAAYPYYGNAYYVSSNSNSNVASASISGTVLNLYASQNGSSNITVCHSSLGFCGTLYVTVGGGVNYGNGLSLSQTNLALISGQSSTVTIYGGGSYYISGNSNQMAASASVSGSMLTVYGNQSGNTAISVCQNGSGYGCATLYVTVTGYAYNAYPYNYYAGGLQYPAATGGAVLGSSVYSNGSLISENGTVFIVYKGTKTAFVSAPVFLGFGFKFGNVSEVGDSGLANSGYTIRTLRASHPWGSWVKSGSTIYFVHETGLIPVSNWSTFVANGGQAEMVVSANSWDMSLPRLSVMTVSDYRLQ